MVAAEVLAALLCRFFQSGCSARQHVKLTPIILTASLMLIAIARVAVAGPLEDGRAAFNRGDYATARRLWYSLADFGNAQALNNIAVMYRDGLGVPQNYDEALRLLNFAIDKNLPEAEYNLGDLLGRPWAKTGPKRGPFLDARKRPVMALSLRRSL